MKIQSDNISYKGYDTRRLKGFLMTSNYGNIAQELKTICNKHGADVFVLRNSEVTKNIPPVNLREYNTDIWAQDLWSVVGKNLLNFYRDTADKRTELFKKFFNLSDSTVQTVKRSKLLNFDTKELERRLYSGIEDDRLLPNFDSYYNACENTHIAGGNIFLTKAENGKNNLIIGENEIKKFTTEELKTMYNADKICFIPQLDYHLDLFIRPLNNNVVLLADELMTEKLLTEFAQKLDKIAGEIPEPKEDKAISSIIDFLKNPSNTRIAVEKDARPFYKSVASKIKNCIKLNREYRSLSDDDADMVEKRLKEAGYNVVRVPASIHKAISKNKCIENGNDKARCLNYVNACTFLNKKNEIVYITNKDMLREVLNITPELKKMTGIEFEKEFKESVKDYIKPENIYFLSGEGNSLGNALLSFEGGLHCLTAEIPA